MKRFLLTLTACALISSASVFAQESKPYAGVAKIRAEKIVSPLNIEDAHKKDKVTALISQQYIALNKIHTDRDEKLKSNQQQAAAIRSSADKDIAKLHVAYLKKLGRELDKAQIEEVKNGMTYHTLPITYANYLLMLPYVSKADKDKILAFLTEAREHAMDGGTSKEKHAWFNKYKGKIANHLSAKGYQMKDEGVEWAKRRDVKSSALEITESNKVIAALNLTDNSKTEPLRNLIAYHYQQMIKIHAQKTIRQEAAKQLEKSAIEKETVAAHEDSKAMLGKQRDLFIVELSKFINPDQVEIVKNEMTAQGLQKENARFHELLPNLTDEHKARINEYLLEARENAMNVLTNRERNQWFAKYRGRANNYLSTKGYDLRKATEDLKKNKQNL